MNRKGSLIVYSGPSGVGKGTVLKEALKKDSSLALSISATTRKPREGEIDGVNYFFITREEFLKKIERGEMLEYAEYNGNFYGTPKDFVEKSLENGKNVILEIEVQGAFKVKDLMPDAVLIFLLPPSFRELRARLEGRKTETKEQIEGRLSAAEREIKEAPKYDFLIVNDDIEETACDLVNCVKAAPFLKRLNEGLLRDKF